MLALKISAPLNWELFLLLCDRVGEEVPLSGASGLNGTFVVVVTDPETKTQKLEYYNERDFNERFRWVDTARPHALTQVVLKKEE